MVICSYAHDTFCFWCGDSLERGVLGHSENSRQVFGGTKGSTGHGNFEAGENIFEFAQHKARLCLLAQHNYKHSPFSLSKVLQLDDRLYAILPLTKDILKHRVEP